MARRARTPAADLQELCAPLEETGTRAVGTAVNDARYDGPECLEPARAAAHAVLKACGVFDGFETLDIDTGEARIHVRRARQRPAAAAPARLSADPRHVAPGRAGARRGLHRRSPPTCAATARAPSRRRTPDHWPYSKRAMARDQVAVMRALGFERFAVCGHDRGARVGYRMALDHPERVERLAVLDIVPTGEALLRADRAFGARLLALVLPRPARADLPERLIGADPGRLLPHFDDGLLRPRGASPRTGAAATTRTTIHAMCEDYRAGDDARLRARPRRPHHRRGSRARARPVGRALAPRGLVRRARDLARVGRRRHAAARSTAGTTSPRSARRRRSPSCARFFATTRSSERAARASPSR